MALETSFVLIESDWPCGRADRLVGGVRPRWIVVHHRRAGDDLYYALERDAVATRLGAAPAQRVGSALELDARQPARTTAANLGPGDRPAVVVSRGRVAGIVPARQPLMLSGELDAMVKAGAPDPAHAIQASAPPEVALGDTVSLVVKLVGGAACKGAIAVAAAVGDTLDVVVQASGGLEVRGKADGVLTVAAERTPMLLFKIAGTAVGPGEVAVLVFQRGQSVGSVDVAIRTVDCASDSPPATATARLRPAPAQVPDVELLVLETGGGESATYTVWLVLGDPSLHANPAPFTFSLHNPRAFFDEFYADVAAILASSATARQKHQRLGAKGTYLFEQLMPRELRDTLWRLRASIHSVHVQSQEPWVPWELIKMSGDDGTGTVVESGFLCEDYEVTRWVPGIGYRPDLTMKQVGLVVPSDSGLVASSAERDALLDLASPERNVVPIKAEEVELRLALASGRFDAIHFAGHGVAGATSADRAEIRLEAGSRLRPEDLTGEVANLHKRSPIVFLNACEIGRAGMGLTQPGGWPRGFLTAGAGAFIGPLWNVADTSAASFAAAFYAGLIDGATVGAAARAARREIQAASDPTWLAYSVYAHGSARLA